MPLPRYLPHVLYSTAVTSLALHLLSQRRGGEERRLQLNARIGVLEGIAARLRIGEDVRDEEIGRLMRMVKGVEEGEASEAKNATTGRDGEKDVSWRSVFRGTGGPSKRDAQDEARIGREIDEALRSDASSNQSR